MPTGRGVTGEQTYHLELPGAGLMCLIEACLASRRPPSLWSISAVKVVSM